MEDTALPIGGEEVHHIEEEVILGEAISDLMTEEPTDRGKSGKGSLWASIVEELTALKL